jgi:hypothetical protein
MSIRGTAVDNGWHFPPFRAMGGQQLQPINIPDWQIKLPLGRGKNDLIVELENFRGHAHLGAARSKIGLFASRTRQPHDVAWNSAADRALVIGSDLKELLSIDATTGTRVVLSDAFVGSSPNRTEFVTGRR